MKIGKLSEKYQLKTNQQKRQQLIPIPKRNLECKTMKTRVYIKVAKQIKEQEMPSHRPFFRRERKHFVDIGWFENVPAANYYFVLLLVS